jgi:hypothetical protein
MRKLIAFIIIFGLFVFPLTAQQEINTHLLRGVWQANRTNPALVPANRLTIGLPGFYNNALITNVTYDDLVVKNEKGENVLDIDRAIGKLAPDNLIRENLDIETVSLGLHYGRLFLSFGHSLRFSALLDYPKTLPQLIWQGNAQFIGQEVDFGFDLHLFSHHEFALGAAFKLTDNLTVGGRLKYLSGVADISTDRRKLNLYTDDDVYQLTLNSDFRVNSAGSLDYDGFSDLTIDFDFGRFDTEELFSGNSGMAFDLGAHLQLGRFDIAVSALDIGSKIDWKKNVTNYSLQGVYEYKGLDVAEGILEDSTDFGSTLDSIRAIYNPVETNLAYSNELPARYYLSATYQLAERWRLGAVYYLESYRDKNDSAFGVGANYQVLPILGLGASYAFRNDRYDNFGVNATFKLGPVQLMAATDNILTAFRPKRSNSANVRIGLNLLFGSVATDPDKISDQESFFK